MDVIARPGTITIRTHVVVDGRVEKTLLFKAPLRLEVRAERPVGSAPCRDFRPPGVVVRVRHDIDDTCDGPVAVQDRAGAWNDLDARDPAKRDPRQIRGFHVHRIKLLAVYKNLHTTERVFAETPHRHLCLQWIRIQRADLEVRPLVQQLGEIPRPGCRNCRRIEDLDVRRQDIRRISHARSIDDDRCQGHHLIGLRTNGDRTCGEHRRDHACSHFSLSPSCEST